MARRYKRATDAAESVLKRAKYLEFAELYPKSMEAFEGNVTPAKLSDMLHRDGRFGKTGTGRWKLEKRP